MPLIILVVFEGARKKSYFQGYSNVIIPSFFLGGYREVETPDPIPNSEVKHFIADGTAHKSVGE